MTFADFLLSYVFWFEVGVLPGAMIICLLVNAWFESDTW